VEGAREAEAHRLHSGSAAHSVENASVEPRLVGALRIARLRHYETRDRHVLGPEARVHALQPKKAVGEKPRAGEQHQRERDLRDHQRRAAARASAAAIPGLLDDL
jgi:hypothetical protein